jgi:tetratricopeptide (TPR) repeat protein
LSRLLLLAGVLLAYLGSLSTPFQFDDRGVILRDLSVHSWPAVASLHGLRPLLKSSYALCWAAGGGSPVYFHLFNLAVHLVNVELVLRLYRAACEPSRFPFGGAPSGGAVVAGLLFGLHPLQTEAVTYVTGRSASLSTAFSLFAVLLYAEGVRSGRARYWLGFAAAAFVLALATKETSAVLPFGLWLWDRAVERSPPRAALRRLLPWLAVFSAALLLLIMHPRYFALLYDVIGRRSLLDSARYQLLGLEYLGARLLLLAPLCIDPGLWLQKPSWLLAGVTLALLGALVAWAAWRRKRVALFGLGWCVLHALLPFLILPRVEVINERHFYAASSGLFLAAGATWSALSARWARPLRVALPATLGLLLGALTLQRNLDYRSELELWQSTVAAAPNNPRAHNNLGVAYELAGRLAEARNSYARALILAPRYHAARDNLTRSTHLLQPTKLDDRD